MTISTSILNPNAAAKRLLWMGINEDDCREALSIGYQHASTCTANHPLSLPGFDAWGWSLGHLRECLIQRGGWEIDRTGNFETVLNPTEKVALAITAGDNGTGVASMLPPQTRTPRGPQTLRAVQSNQMNLLGQGSDDEAGVQTWLLLHYLNKSTGEIQAELSLPNDMSRRVINSWEERILLNTTPFDSKPMAAPLPAENEAVDVEIRRKAS